MKAEPITLRSALSGNKTLNPKNVLKNGQSY